MITGKLRRLRKKHIKHGHPFESSTLIDILYSELHPHTDEHHVYTVAIRTCDECGLTWNDCGLTPRHKVKGQTK